MRGSRSPRLVGFRNRYSPLTVRKPSEPSLKPCQPVRVKVGPSFLLRPFRSRAVRTRVS